ncbi:hypothetical protein ACHAWO_010351 [Cyclotella atomus]|uniref:Charged multivesicular body protein 6 n=1 Tax=Cyclotella atomus TaxID=382360 RepID=A0ABD3NIJ7_9STRA
MGGIISKESKSKSKQPKGGTITPLDRAILDLKNSRDRLTKYRSKLEADSSKLATRAKSLHAEGKTTYALHLLRLRKYKLQETDRVDEQLITVLRLVEKISEKQNEQEVIIAMKRGKDALQILHDEMGLDDVLDLMDDIRDQDEVEKKINEILGSEGLRVVDEMGEEDILMELEQLEEEVRLESETKDETTESLPAVPTKPLPQVDKPKMNAGDVKVALSS